MAPRAVPYVDGTSSAPRRVHHDAQRCGCTLYPAGAMSRMLVCDLRVENKLEGRMPGLALTFL
eukprot:4902098-Prymnesium_polylepis.1